MEDFAPFHVPGFINNKYKEVDVKNFRKVFRLVLLALAISVFTVAGQVCAGSFNYISVDEFKARMDAGDHDSGAMAIVTTQTEEEYSSGHLKAAYPTFSRPLKAQSDFEKLYPFMELVKESDSDIVIICPRGRGGAEIPYRYFVEHGIAEDRLLILKDGQEAFNRAYPDDVSYGN